MTQKDILTYIFYTPFNINYMILENMVVIWKKGEQEPPEGYEFFGITNYPQLKNYIEKNIANLNYIILKQLLSNISSVYQGKIEEIYNSMVDKGKQV